MTAFEVGDKIRMLDPLRADGPSGVVEVLEVGDCRVDDECGATGHDRTFLRIHNDRLGGIDWMHGHNFEHA